MRRNYGLTACKPTPAARRRALIWYTSHFAALLCVVAAGVLFVAAWVAVGP